MTPEPPRSAAADGGAANVSDTARWVAVYRAFESTRPDALFHDPLAKRLAGARGQTMAAQVPGMMRSGWWMAVRTRTIDDLIAKALSEGCDLVINMAAGLDTRPYRLDLPPALRWIEVDLPLLLAEKDHLLSDQAPRCRLTRHAVDLADTADRDGFLVGAVAGATKALVLTEGLSMYLEPAQVAAVSQSLTRPEIAWWILDLAGPGLKKWMNEKTGGLLSRTPFRFAPDNGVAFLEALGWHPLEIVSILDAGARWRRLPWYLSLAAHLPQPGPRRPGRRRPWSAVIRLERR